jgi:hypothetical protein
MHKGAAVGGGKWRKRGGKRQCKLNLRIDKRRGLWYNGRLLVDGGGDEGFAVIVGGVDRCATLWYKARKSGRRYFVITKYKYRHTFYLHSGEVIVAYSDVKEMGHVTFGRETAFLASDEYNYYTIPFTSVNYVQTEKTDE